MKKEVREAKGQVSEHYRKQLLKVQKRVEEATKVSQRTVRRILGEQKKHEAQGTSFSSHGKTHKVPKCVTDIDGISVCEHVDELEKQYFERKGITDERIESIIITYNGTSNSDSESDE
jgi:ribosome recycling factor